MKKLIVFLSFFYAAGTGWSQDAQPDRVTVPFSDPARPKSLKASLINGSITVKGYDGKDAIVEARPEAGGRRRAERPDRSDGLRRIDLGGTGLVVEESENVITVGTRSVNENISLNIQVPFNTSLKLHAVNGGDIVVDHINGDVEIDNTNGNATATHVSGSAVVHALNGKVLVSLDKVTPDKPMSFSSLNGDIDVSLPPDVKAKVRLKSDNGAVYSDFDIALDASSRKPVVQDNNSGRGKYRVQFDRATYGSINGGGPEMQLTTFNGNIYIRKLK
jgi:putative adhesin